ncbi:protein kinase [Okeania sp. SIO2B3]|uniref:protein kinase domain-containing protein n=1 Tax=Okeania sp. SIO2B3 TaxID=2607784 RepID=UPI0013BFE2D5|nr:serine/threonine-protein kinase [Okeania sp. SIO2B3]NET41698.1 serine/threonine protein kinase [Okeania sp. SIO2B3]
MNQGNEQFPKDPLIGQIITGEKGKYRIVKLLGKGGFGSTYLAKDLSHNNSKCAVKKLENFSEKSTRGNRAIQDFDKESKTLKKIDHERVPKMIDFFTFNLPYHQEESRFLVQEYIEGNNLKKEFENNKKNEIKWDKIQVILFLIDVLEILFHLQTQSISGKILIHRDIKPGNLIRRRQDRRVYLIDFGLVKLISSNDLQKHQTATYRGTPSYMAPEQQKGQPSPCSDIYSVGLVAIEGLIGKYPLSHCYDTDEIAKVKWQDLLSEVDEKVSQILMKMVSFDPKERYKFARDVLNDLPALTLNNNTYTYKIKSYLGSGKFGNTYLAECIEEGKTYHCVIKQLKLENNNNLNRSKAREKFKYEVAALTLLGSHNRIPKLVDSFEESGEHNISDQSAFYLVQEYIEGEDIRQELLREKSWNQNQVIEFLKQLLEILIFIHKNHVIHCDIKPSNIMQRFSDGKFVLIDFGSVKKAVSFSENFNQSSTSTQSLKTRYYMSPEQSQGNEQIEYNSDIYSLGITAIQALIGKEPYQLGLRDKKTGKYNWSNNIQVDNRLVRILDKMVAFDPVQRRYKSAQEVLNDLGKLERKKIFKIQPSIKWNVWMVAITFGAIVCIMLLSWAIFIDDSSNKKRNIAFKLRKEADELISIGQPEKATEKLEEAYKLYQQLIDSNPKNPKYLIDKAYTLSKLGKLDQEYLESCNNAKALAKELAKEKKIFLLLYAETYNCIAVYHQEQGKYDTANDYHKIAIKEYEKVEKENSNNEKYKGEIRQSYAEALNNRGQTFKKWGYQEETEGNNQTALNKYKLALEFFSKSLQKIQENKQLSDYNSYLETDYNKSLGEVYFREGTVHKKMSDKQQANLSFDNSQKFYSDALKLINENYDPLKAVTLLGRARVYLELENKNFKGASEDCEDIQYLAVNLEIKGRAWICLAKIARSDPEQKDNFETYKTYKDFAIGTLTEAVDDCKLKNTSDKTCEELKKLQRNVEQDILDF